VLPPRYSLSGLALAPPERFIPAFVPRVAPTPWNGLRAFLVLFPELLQLYGTGSGLYSYAHPLTLLERVF